jgi:hypothetical protein
MIAPAQLALMNIDITSVNRLTGTYTATMVIDATPGTIGAPIAIPVKLHIVDQIIPTYLPAVQRKQ